MHQVPGYQIVEQLYSGSRTVVYRAIPNSNNTPIILKFLQKDYPTFSELIQFRNQYTLGKNLDIIGVIKTYDLDFAQNRYILSMEDFGGISLSAYLALQNQYIPLEQFLNIAIHLAHTLQSLHQERIIHKDIKPANILINPQTQEVKITDFSISSLLPRETQEIQNPNILEGTLAYISPEQTGRMNRGIDYRTDFYSLGVTFYEILIGQLPFVSEEVMELVHCHLAKQPVPIHEVNSEIPEILSQIVSKLMAKNAEDRYQSAFGLKHDLEICLTQFVATGEITNFELGERDITDAFIIPEKLYGRENEVVSLLAAFDRVSGGSPQPPLERRAFDLERGTFGASELMLVAGFSGIGKTAVVNEVHKPIVRQRGYFIKGKYDQFQRNIPFSAFVQAFRDLMGQLLSESESQLQTWKSKILSAVGENGQVLIEVIPELERIIGTQPPATELSGTAAQNRFNLLMQKFIKVFTSQEHPLVIFLDDLQWSDSASLNLLQLLMQDTKHLLILGAYRDNEVSTVHPFIITIDDIVKSGAIVNTINLQPLNLADVNRLVADTLNCNLSLAQPLTELVYQKTKGNPFFATQFLKALHQDELITFNPSQFPLSKGGKQGGWQCDIAQVRALAITDDVVEFMALQLQKLPPETQNILKLAACIGAQFDLDTLAIISEKSAEVVATELWKSLQSGLIIPTTEVYKFFTQSDTLATSNTSNTNVNLIYRFLHDRVQQAAYSLIPDAQKTATHLKIGQLLQQNSSEIEQEEKLFDIVSHLNLGMELITQPEEREELANLNLKAGSKARNSTAYAAARIYIQRGINLLEINCWQSQYALTLDIYTVAAEVAYLQGDFEEMEQRIGLILQKAQTVLDKVKIYEISIAALATQGKLLEALAVARDSLGQLSVELPAEPDPVKISEALQTLGGQLQGIKIEDLLDLPVMTDARAVAAMQLLSMLNAPIIQSMPGLLPLLGSTMVSLSLQFGNAPASSVGYVTYGMVLSVFLGDVKAGYAFGQLSLHLLEKFNAMQFKSVILLMLGGFIEHSQQALRTAIPTHKSGYLAGLETGDFFYSGLNIFTYSYMNLFAGVELENWESEIASYSAALAEIKQYSPQTYVDMLRQMIKNLREQVNQPDILIGTFYDETLMISKHFQDSEFTAIAMVYIYKLMLAYLWRNYRNGLDYISSANQSLMAVSGFIFVPAFHFYAALTYLALFSTQPEPEQVETLAVVETHQSMLRQWAENAPMNHLHKWYLVEAEKQRVLGNKAEAIDLYDRSIALAKENLFLNEEALANELAMKFYLEWEKEKIAQIYAIEAYYCYTRWGAKAKVIDLETRYPQLLTPILQQSQQTSRSPETTPTYVFQSTFQATHTSSLKSISETLDLATVLKVSQTISSEIELDKLIATLLQAVEENAGATKSVLLLKTHENIELVALSENATTQIIQVPLDSCTEVPIAVINYVNNTQETIVIDQVATSPTFTSDLYLKHQPPQSLMCVPLVSHGTLIGMIYLENNLITNAFTSNRLALLQMLTGSAAIALENARLYQQSQQALNDLKEAQLQIVQSEKMSALGNLVAGVAHEINNPVGFLSGNIKIGLSYISDIFGLLDLIKQKYPQLDPEIQEEMETIELDYIQKDLPKLIGSMHEGIKRIQDISTSLRTFSRADSDRPVAFNLHEGIDSTILILKHRLKADDKRPEIQVIKNYGSLPQVECYAGQLNQVFMNIIANAIDALDESNTGKSYAEIEQNPNSITITTSVEDNYVKIAIADNGKGMSEEVKQRIFDHLFTTKVVGKGTGLGLAIARQIIVEKHHGTIAVNSELGQGTEFIIILPISN